MTSLARTFSTVAKNIDDLMNSSELDAAFEGNSDATEVVEVKEEGEVTEPETKTYWARYPFPEGEDPKTVDRKCYGCGGPAVIRTTKKEGPNIGRTFATCAAKMDKQCECFQWTDDPFVRVTMPAGKVPAGVSTSSPFASFHKPSTPTGTQVGVEGVWQGSAQFNFLPLTVSGS